MAKYPKLLSNDFHKQQISRHFGTHFGGGGSVQEFKIELQTLHWAMHRVVHFTLHVYKIPAPIFFLLRFCHKNAGFIGACKREKVET